MGPPGQPWAGLSGFWGFPPFLALVETVAVAVHLQDMNVVCEPVQQRPSQALGPVADRAGARGGRERQDSRLPAFLRVEGAGAGREPARDRQAARAQPDPDHRPVCASGAGFGQGRGGAGRRQHLGGFPEGRFGNGEAARATGYGQSRVTSYRGTAGTAKRRQASSLSPRARRVTLSDAGMPGNIDFSEFVRWPVAERPITGKASRERIPVL